MTTVVISQPMFFPWPGFLEQVATADVLVHYDDVQFSKGSFTNRVQVKTAQGVKWMTVPLQDLRLGDSIMETHVKPTCDWAPRHLALLSQAYGSAPFVSEMLALVKKVYEHDDSSIAGLSIASTHALLDYFGITLLSPAVRASTLGIGGTSTARVLAVVKRVGGDHYVTGHGARHYLGHEEMEAAGVRVSYLDYQLLPYPQLHGPFTPYVSSLDLIAHCGREGRALLASPAIPWRAFLARFEEQRIDAVAS
jgi:hypothetical protein